MAEAGKPVRLQLSRKRGFNLQALSMATNGLPAVNVARPSVFGNPFTAAGAIEAGYLKSADEPLANQFLVGCFRSWLTQNFGMGEPGWWMGPESDRSRALIMDNIAKLRGKNLACFCEPGEPCHADVLLELANRPIHRRLTWGRPYTPALD